MIHLAAINFIEHYSLEEVEESILKDLAAIKELDKDKFNIEAFIKNNKLGIKDLDQLTLFVNSGLAIELARELQMLLPKEIIAKIKDLHWFVEKNHIEAADKLLQETPMHQLPLLLKMKSKVKTSAKGLTQHIIVRGTALRMALGFTAVGRDDKEEGMVEMLHRHMRRAMPNGEGEREIAKQTLEQFPDGWLEQEEKQYDRDLAAYKKYRKAISDSKSDEYPARRLLPAREEYRKHFEPSSESILETGKFGRTRLLSTMFQISSDEFFDDSPYGFNRDGINLNRCAGWLQRLEPENCKQEMAQGLRNSRALGKKSKKWAEILLPDALTGASSDSWVDAYHGVECYGIEQWIDHTFEYVSKRSLGELAAHFSEFYKSKDAKILSYVESARELLHKSAIHLPPVR